MTSFIDVSFEENSVSFQDDSPTFHASTDDDLEDTEGSITLLNDKYVVKGIIGRGAFGVVNLVVDYKHPNSEFALKQVLCSDDKAINNAMNEAWPLRKLQHETLVKIETIFVHSGHNSVSNLRELYVCFVMPFYKEGDLDKFLKKRLQNNEYLSESELLNFMNQLSSGVACLHENNFLHRDLKPSNIFMSNSYKSLHIGDFGLMRTLENTAQCNTVAGTVKYMAPEMLGQNTYSFPADIWSLGCIFFELTQLKLEKNMYMEVFMNPNYISDLKNMIQKRGYSSEISELVCNMLLKETVNRPSVTQVLEKVSFLMKNVNDVEPTSPKPKIITLEESIAEAVDTYMNQFDKINKSYQTIEGLTRIEPVRKLLSNYRGNIVNFVTNALISHSKCLEFNRARTEVRKSRLQQRLINAVEKHFSDDHYYRDKFLLSIASHDEDGYIPITVIMSLKAISNILSRHTNISADKVALILKDCIDVQVSDDLTMVRKRNQDMNSDSYPKEKRFATKIDSYFSSSLFDRASRGSGSISPDQLLSSGKLLKMSQKLNINNDDIVTLIEKHCQNVQIVKSENSGHVLLSRKESSLIRRTITLPVSDFEFGISTHELSEFTVATFNVTSQSNVQNFVNYTAAKWKRRVKNIIGFVEHYKPDIICLQEIDTNSELYKRSSFHKRVWSTENVDRFNAISQYLSKMGYIGHFKPNTSKNENEMLQGVAIFVIKTRMEVLGVSNIELGPEIRSNLSTDLENVDQTAQILHLRLLNKHILVCNTQLCLGIEMEHIRVLQVQSIMSYIQKHFGSQLENTAIIMCGDFQSEPNSAVYDLIHDGKLSNRTKMQVDQSAQNVNFIMPSEELQSDILLKSCYDIVLGREPSTCFTNDNMYTFDFIMCSRTIWPNAVLEQCDLEKIRRDAALQQNRTFASHHVPLLVKFQFCKYL